MHGFDTDTRVETLGDNRFSAVISPDWSINTIPNGGYLMGLAVKAMERVSGFSMASIITMGFYSRCCPGDAEIRVETHAESTRFKRLLATLYQEGSMKLSALGTFSTVSHVPLERRYETGPPELPNPERCIPMPAMPGYTLYDRMDVLMEPSCCGWISGSPPSDLSEHRGWIRFKSFRELDCLSVVLMADAFPPPVFASQGMVAWVPTLEFSVNIREIVPTFWVKAVFRTRFITGDMVEEDGELWSEAGDLIAVSRQVAQYRR